MAIAVIGLVINLIALAIANWTLNLEVLDIIICENHILSATRFDFSDKMIISLIVDKDIVIIEQTQFVSNGDTIVALLEDNTVTLKRFYKEKDQIRLKPANEKYTDILCKNIIVQGKVVAIYRKY